jgi:hypothetical protein
MEVMAMRVLALLVSCVAELAAVVDLQNLRALLQATAEMVDSLVGAAVAVALEYLCLRDRVAMEPMDWL